MREESVVKAIERSLTAAGRMYMNVHGSTFSKNGAPDFMTMDRDGVLTGVEAKAPGEQPRVNQWRRAIEILKSRGRYVVAYDDFSVDALDRHELPVAKIGSEIGESEFEMTLSDRTKTTEIKLR